MRTLKPEPAPADQLGMRTYTDNREGAGRVIRYSDTANPTDPGLNGILELSDAEAAAGHDRPLIAALKAGGYGQVA